MMEKINDGGPAFPIGSTPYEWGNGMTLRDYFAAKALQGIESNPDKSYEPKHLAERAFLIADAMLAAREVQS